MNIKKNSPIHIEQLSVVLSDEVVFPENIRYKLMKGFTMLENKVKKLPKKKHGNIPL